MRVLIITGDKSFGPGHHRFALQQRAADALAVVYWGREALWPPLPQDAYDVVTVQDPFWRGLFGWHAARQKRARFNVQVHTDLSASGFLKRMLARFVLHRADSVRVVSEKLRQQVIGMHVRAPIRILPVYIDGARFFSVIRRPSTRPVILWVGRFEDEKNPLGAIDVLGDVRQRGVDAMLVMLGDGSLKKEAHAYAATHQMENVVSFEGWQADVIPFLSEASVVLSTSTHESFGASIVEALAAGVPVVAPDVGVAKEAGAIVVPREQLANAILEVLNTGMRGELRLQLPDAGKWATKWHEGLL